VNKKLYRSSRQQVFSGVCGGLAEYFDIDVTLIRIVWALSIISGVGLLLYIIAAIIIPKGENASATIVVDENGEKTVIHEHDGSSTKNNSVLVLGSVMIIIGGLSLMNRLFPFRYFWNEVRSFGWPAILIIVGVLFLASSLKKK